MQKPSPGKNCKSSGWKWDDSCLYFEELQPDPTLLTPAGIKPYLIGFDYSASAGNPLVLPMWYRFRYVNVNTGGYSDFSEWTQSPVISGSCCLPCPEGAGKCSFSEGGGTCSFNRPTIGVKKEEAQYDPYTPTLTGDYIYINIHRYVGSDFSDISPPDENVQDEIVGYLIPGKVYNGETYYYLIDVLFNPITSSFTVPNWCVSPDGSTCNESACANYS